MKFRNCTLLLAATASLMGADPKANFKASAFEYPMPSDAQMEGRIEARLLLMGISVKPPSTLRLPELPKPPAGVYVEHMSGGPDRGFMDMLKGNMLERGKGTALFIAEDADTALVTMEIDILISREPTRAEKLFGARRFGIGGPAFEVLATARDRCKATVFTVTHGDLRWVDTTPLGPAKTAERIFKSFKKALRKKGSELNAALRGAPCRMGMSGITE